MVTMIEAPPHDLTTAEGRLNEIRRTKDIIGWSWKTVGERLGLTFSQSQALQTGKRAVADSDLEWLQQLAELVASLPRPPVVGMPEPAPMSASDERAAEQRGRTMMRDEVVRSIADQYAAIEDQGLNEDQLAGAKHGLALVATSLGLLDAVRAVVESRKAAVPKVAEALQSAAPPAWEPPVMQRDLGERGRVPF